MATLRILQRKTSSQISVCARPCVACLGTLVCRSPRPDGARHTLRPLIHTQSGSVSWNWDWILELELVVFATLSSIHHVLESLSSYIVVTARLSSLVVLSLLGRANVSCVMCLLPLAPASPLSLAHSHKGRVRAAYTISSSEIAERSHIPRKMPSAGPSW